MQKITSRNFVLQNRLVKTQFSPSQKNILVIETHLPNHDKLNPRKWLTLLVNCHSTILTMLFTQKVSFLQHMPVASFSMKCQSYKMGENGPKSYRQLVSRMLDKVVVRGKFGIPDGKILAVILLCHLFTMGPGTGIHKRLNCLWSFEGGKKRDTNKYSRWM